MNKLPALFLIFLLISCTHSHKPGNKGISSKPVKSKASTDTSTEKPLIRYSDQQLEAFLDSIGHLPVGPLAGKVALDADSGFRNQRQLDTTLSSEDFNKLKRAARKGLIAVNIARRIFGNNGIDSACNVKSVLLTYKLGLIPIEYYPFNKNKNGFDEFAFCVGDPEHCGNAYLYFFKGQKIIAMHNGYDRDGLDLNHFTDIDNKTVIHYKVEFDRGSGIWWYQFFFYKYDDNKLIPVLSIPQNINLLQPSPWEVRELWLECSIQKATPLVIKMVYHQQLPDPIEHDHFTTDAITNPMIVDDSTYVRYSWNEHTKSLEGNFKGTKINKAQILSYYLENNESLFINAYYSTLKTFLIDKKKRKWTLDYLNQVKSQGLK